MFNEKFVAVEQMARGFVCNHFKIKFIQKRQGEILRKEVTSFYTEVNHVKDNFSKELMSYTHEMRKTEQYLDN